MAKVQASPLALQWGHTPMGEFYISFALPIALPDGQQGFAPLHVFVLTKDEEDSLKAELKNITIAKSIPKSNGLHLVQ